MKPIRLSGHAKEQLFTRVTTEAKVVETVKTSSWQPAELGRLECKKDFVFGNEWDKKYYKTKWVRPNFLKKREKKGRQPSSLNNSNKELL